MTRRLYTKRSPRRPLPGLIIGISGLILTGWLIWNWQPDRWWKEMIVVTVAGLSMVIIASWVFFNRKLGAILAIGLVGLFIFNRLGILDLVSMILLMVVLGLITLVN